MLQTDERFPGIDSNGEGLVQSPDGSHDLYFGPTPRVIFRLYGQFEPWYAKTWRPGDPELVR